MADMLRIPVRAYVRRSEYKDTWGTDKDRYDYYRCEQATTMQNMKGWWKDGEKRSEEWCNDYERRDKKREKNVKAYGVVFDEQGAAGDVRVSEDSYLRFTPEQIMLIPR